LGYLNVVGEPVTWEPDLREAFRHAAPCHKSRLPYRRQHGDWFSRAVDREALTA